MVDASLDPAEDATLDAAPDATVDAAADAMLDAGCDATLDATGDAAAVFHDITNPSYWTTFDTASVNAGANSFVGAAFDGRYVYFAPNGDAPFDGIVTRYDTQYMGGGGGVGASAAWATFDTSTVNAGAKGFAGATFDGRFIYFVPWSNGVNDGIVTRFDTQGAFLATASWATFDASIVNAAAVGFVGAAFDGRYVYLVPGWSGVVARYDTQYMGGGAFGASAAWAAFDIATVNPKRRAFRGARSTGAMSTSSPGIMAPSTASSRATTRNLWERGHSVPALRGRPSTSAASMSRRGTSGGPRSTGITFTSSPLGGASSRASTPKHPHPRRRDTRNRSSERALSHDDAVVACPHRADSSLRRAGTRLRRSPSVPHDDCCGACAPKFCRLHTELNGSLYERPPRCLVRRALGCHKARRS